MDEEKTFGVTEKDRRRKKLNHDKAHKKNGNKKFRRDRRWK